jgi:DNA-binding NarL/FixJ family response regulator
MERFKMTPPLSTIIADSQSVVRHALRTLFHLNSDLRVNVVGEAASADELQSLLALRSIDLLILDADLIGLAREGGVRAIRKLCPGTAIIVLGVRPESRSAALAAEAECFCSKVDGVEYLLACIQTIQQSADRSANAGFAS